jgi:tetratricopeptide (TPR) repeat protein
VALWRQAQQRYPADFWINFNLASALWNPEQGPKQNLDEAIGYYRASVALRPRTGPAHNNLANALNARGEVAAAIAEYKNAIALNAKDALAHNNLGNVLRAQGLLADAVIHFQKAIALDSKDAWPHYNLGNALYAQGRLEAAITEYRAAIRLDPNLARAHQNLGYIFQLQGRPEEAISHYHRAIALDPKDVRAYRNLGWTLRGLGRFAEARDALRRCLARLPAQDRRRLQVGQTLRQCQRLLALEAKLLGILQGEVKPANAAEQIEYALLCQLKKRYAAAARFWAAGFAADPKLAQNMKAQNRYYAACAAARVGSGQDPDGAQLSDRARARWRKQALDWLRADLAWWQKWPQSTTPGNQNLVQRTLTHWLGDRDLAGVREEAALAGLPTAERQGWRQFWAEVRRLAN